ncbi:hypothetical protein ACPPVO_13120 [Dactylosporangium sp. McL0621]|uniref:hypothetical protein n=1 Tax=Dactylosporangium sp. McL0621 TaxID=3415678 RepID=UPI003CF8CFCF
MRFTNTGRVVQRLDGFEVLADGRPLARRSAPAAVDLRPGATADETVTFAAPELTADLTLNLADGSQLALDL